MPVSIVVGGQYGSEGKGKVAHYFAEELGAVAAIKVSGTNSGHTVYDKDGNPQILRVLPSPSLIPGMYCVIAPGAYFQPRILFDEMKRVGFPEDHLLIHPNAGVITEQIEREEKWSDLRERIGSTLSGTGIATCHRISCDGEFVRACEVPELDNYLVDTDAVLRKWLDEGKHIIIEGGQGFGLSLLHCNCYPYCTSRDTSASAFLADAGLSPLDVENVIQVLRSYEIRVAGNSGPMFHETTWEQVTKDAKSTKPISEMTSVSKRIRRVGYFDFDLVKRAVDVNQPNITVMNFMDYIGEDDPSIGSRELGPNRMQFLQEVCRRTGAPVTHVGFAGDDVRPVKDLIWGRGNEFAEAGLHLGLGSYAR